MRYLKSLFFVSKIMYSKGHRSDKTASVPAITINIRDGLSKVYIAQHWWRCITKQNNASLIRSTIINLGLRILHIWKIPRSFNYVLEKQLLTSYLRSCAVVLNGKHSISGRGERFPAAPGVSDGGVTWCYRCRGCWRVRLICWWRGHRSFIQVLN